MDYGAAQASGRGYSGTGIGVGTFDAGSVLAAPPPKDRATLPGVISASDEVNRRLEELVKRSASMADVVGGSIPTAGATAQNAVGASSAIDALDQKQRTTFDLIRELDGHLNRLFSVLSP